MKDESRSKFLKGDLVWTLEEAKELLKEGEKVYKDQSLYNKVKDKVLIVEKLKKSLKDVMEKKHDMKIVKEYIFELKEVENIDFQHEIKLAEKKL